MKYYDSMQDLIGNTPLVKLTNIPLPEGAHLFAKLELYNPAGSVKDRIGKYMLADAEEKGLLKPGDTIVEATAGNTGLGIAFAALNRGYKVIFVVPRKFSEEKQTLMRALGAEIINTPREGGMLGQREKLMKSEIPFPEQYPWSNLKIKVIHWHITKLQVPKYIRIWMEKLTTLLQVQEVVEHIQAQCVI